MRIVGMLAALVILGATPPVHAETVIVLKESSAEMSKGIQSAVSVVIPRANSKDVVKEWNKKLKTYKAKVKGRKGEQFADNALIKQMSENTVDIYTLVTDTVDGASMLVFVDLGGAWLTSASHPSQYKVTENIVYLFAVDIAKAALGEEIKAADSKLSDMNKALERLDGEKRSLEKEIENNQTAIQRAQQAIDEANKLIGQNGSNQAAQMGEIEKQKGVIQLLRTEQEGVK